MEDKTRAVYTKGPIGSRMLKTGLAMLAGTLAMSGYNIVDTYFVGKLGETPLAAIGFTMPVIMLIGCVFHGLGTGVMTTAAQAIGGDRREKAATLVTSGVLLVLLISTMLALLGYFTSGPVFEAFGAHGKTLEQVRGYMNIWYLGCATASLAMLGNDLLIAVGDSKTAGPLMVIGLVLNAVIDPLFIYGVWYVPHGIRIGSLWLIAFTDARNTLQPVLPDITEGGRWLIPAMGIRGAALATIFCQFVSTVLALGVMWKKHKLLHFSVLPGKELFASWRLTIRYALPASMGMLMMPIGSAVITWITAKFGDAAVAATAASGRLEMIAFVFPMALGMSLMPMVGQNFGAKMYTRIRTCLKFSVVYAFIFLFGMTLVYNIFADELVCLFVDEAKNPEVCRIMAQCLRITSWGFAAIEIHRYSGFFFIGCGRPAVAAWLNALRIMGLMLPFSFLALYFHHLEGLFFARMAADMLAGGTGVIMAWCMTRHLPADGEPVPPHQQSSEIFRKVFHRRNLHAFVQAQTKIDSSSDTQ